MDNLEESDKLLETYNLPKLNLEKIGTMNRWITSSETESVILKHKQTKKNSQQTKVKDQIAS